jgi:NitT/TauT family transport system permease protein
MVRLQPATLIRTGALLACCGALEWACRSGLIGRFTLIPPSQMVVGLANILRAGQLDDEIGATIGGVAIAAVGAIGAGFALGAILHATPRLRACLDPLLATYYAVPIYVFYPMFLVFFGMNRLPIIAIGFLFAVVAMMTGTLNGLDRVPTVLKKTARVLGMTPLSTTLHIVLPAAAPSIFGGVKLAIAYAFVGVLGAEFILSNSGLGYQIALAFNNFDNTAMYSLILLVVVVVAGVNSSLLRWERVLLRRRQM